MISNRKTKNKIIEQHRESRIWGNGDSATQGQWDMKKVGHRDSVTWKSGTKEHWESGTVGQWDSE